MTKLCHEKEFNTVSWFPTRFHKFLPHLVTLKEFEKVISVSSSFKIIPNQSPKKLLLGIKKIFNFADFSLDGEIPESNDPVGGKSKSSLSTKIQKLVKKISIKTNSSVR